LLHHPHHIQLTQVFDSLPIGDADEVNLLYVVDLLAGGWDAHEVPALGAGGGMTSHHHIALGDHILSGGLHVRESAKEHSKHHFHALGALGHSGWQLILLDVVRSHQFIQYCQVPLVYHLINEPAVVCLVLL